MVMLLGAAEWKGKVPLQIELGNLEFKLLYRLKCKPFSGMQMTFCGIGKGGSGGERLQRSKYKGEIHPQSFCHRSFLNVALFSLQVICRIKLRLRSCALFNQSESTMIITASNSAFIRFWLLLRLTLNDKFKVYSLQQDKLRLFSCTM